MEKLQRRLNLPVVVAISIGSMLGSGLFLLPGLAVITTGPSVWLAYIVAGFLVLPAALSQGELATAMGTGRGTFEVLDHTFGPLIGTISGLGLWLSIVLKAAFALVGFGAYLWVFVDIPFEVSALGLLAVLCTINIFGVRGVRRIEIAVVIIVLVGLATLCLIGVIHIDRASYADSFRHGGSGFVAAVALVFISYAGLTRVADLAGEVRRPGRNVPLGFLLSLLAMTTIYGLVTLILVGNLGVTASLELPGLASDTRPLYTLGKMLSGWPVIGTGAAVLGIVALAAMANAGLLDAAKLPFSMGRADLLPPQLARLDRVRFTPTRSIVVSALVVAAAVLMLDVISIVKLASAFTIIIFIALNASVLLLRESRVQWYEPSFRAPLYPWVQGAGILSGLVVLTALGGLAAVAGLSVTAAGGFLFLLHGRQRASRMGVLGQRAKRRDLLTTGQFSTVRARTAAPDAHVVVALFGNEHSPETLTELAAALAEGKSIHVVHLTELPEQTTIDALKLDEPRRTSVKRRVLAMARVRELDLTFEAITSRDVIGTINDLTSEQQCQWLVTEWTRRGGGRVTFNNPLGWLRDRTLGSNLATFYDGGVRYFREIMVYVEPGPHDALVLGTADHLGEVHGANLTFVRYLPEGAAAEDIQAAGDYLDQVRELCSAPSETMILRGHREDRALIDASGSTDLMITAGAARDTFLAGIRGSVWDRVTERAACSVLRLRTPPAQGHEPFEKYRATSETSRKIVDYVDPRCVLAGIEPAKKDSLFHTFAGAFAQLSDTLEESAIVAGLWERERSQNTALGGGLALPHATLTESEHTHLGIFTTAKPVDFDAPDDVRVDVFLVTIGPPRDRQEHLRLLGSIARLCSKTDFLARVRAAWSVEEILSVLAECAAEVDS